MSSRLIRVLIASTVALALILIFAGLSPWLAVPAAILPLHLAILWGQLSPYSQWLGPTVTRFHSHSENREIWLTIDDGPDPEETPAVLDVLDQHRQKATFFLIGSKAAGHPEIVREIRRRGHQVANHSWSHRQYLFWALPGRKVAEEIDQASSVLVDCLDGEPLPPLFRSPVGMRALALSTRLEERGLHLVAWTIRGRDGAAKPDLDRALKRLAGGIAPGAILVLHEGRGHAPDLLDRLLTRVQADGFTCIIPSPDRFLCGDRP